jgi:putative ABC transport system permease protein
MLLALGWKNIWRNPIRSVIIIVAIGLGLTGGIVSSAFWVGMAESMVNLAIDRDVSHIQIHQPGYQKDLDIDMTITDGSEILGDLWQNTAVKAASGRFIIKGMAATPYSTFGIAAYAIDPQKERQLTSIHSKIIEGNYLPDSISSRKRSAHIIVGKKLAERLNLKLNRKVILSFQWIDGEIQYLNCRVTGIYKTNASMFDDTHVYLHRDQITRQLGNFSGYHEIAMKLQYSGLIPEVQKTLQDKYPSVSVENWKELSPELALINNSMTLFLYIFVGIILFALLFGIVNTMLMSVMDRVREFGVLLAVGMSKIRVFTLVIIETIMLTSTGGFIGLGLSFGMVEFLKIDGIDFSIYQQSLESFGASSIVYPNLDPESYFLLFMMVVITANVAAVLPARRAINLKPAVAIRDF